MIEFIADIRIGQNFLDCVYQFLITVSNSEAEAFRMYPLAVQFGENRTARTARSPIKDSTV